MSQKFWLLVQVIPFFIIGIADPVYSLKIGIANCLSCIGVG